MNEMKNTILLVLMKCFFCFAFLNGFRIHNRDPEQVRKRKKGTEYYRGKNRLVIKQWIT